MFSCSVMCPDSCYTAAIDDMNNASREAPSVLLQFQAALRSLTQRYKPTRCWVNNITNNYQIKRKVIVGEKCARFCSHSAVSNYEKCFGESKETSYIFLSNLRVAVTGNNELALNTPGLFGLLGGIDILLFDLGIRCAR